MSQMPLPFGDSTPPAVLQPAPPSAGAARVAAYRTLCTQMEEDPAVLVLVVTAGRTGDPARLSDAELGALARAWSGMHPTPARLTSTIERADAGITPGVDRGHDAHPSGDVAVPVPDRAVEAPPEARTSTEGRDARRRGAPYAPGRRDVHRDERGSEREQPARLCARPATRGRASEARLHGQGSSAVEPDERYVVAIAPELLRALRMRAVRDGTQMRVLVARVVADLLDELDPREEAPGLAQLWRVPSARRTRLAMRWPAGLADRLRAAAATTGLPAYELVALAIVPLIASNDAQAAR